MQLSVWSLADRTVVESMQTGGAELHIPVFVLHLEP
jgi:hypothetical protein